MNREMKNLRVQSIVLLAVLFLGFAVSCRKSKTAVYLNNFSYTNAENIPAISAHRGGKGIFGYPENCLETMTYVNDKINAIFEIDVAQTKDGKLVLMHDNAINRTTTGDGLLRKLTYKELSRYNLVDDYGTVTDFKVPLFSDVVKWSMANNVILTVDVKRGVSQHSVIKAIQGLHAQSTCILITYDLEQAKSAHKLAPELVLSVSARNEEEFNRLLRSRIPTQNMVAFTGTRLSPTEHYKSIHNEDVLCILGTLGNLDKQAQARGDQLYLSWVNKGIDILATDRPIEAYNAIYNTIEK
jgi:glycerophosphoryl diester phosphodiesterase